MERDFNRDDFENFLKQKSNQYKIYPSPKTWRGIYNSFHPGNRWYTIGGSLLILTGLFFISQEIFFKNSSSKLPNGKNTQNLISKSHQNTTEPISEPINYNADLNSYKKVNTSKRTNSKANPIRIKDEHAQVHLKAYEQTNRSLIYNDVIKTENALIHLTTLGSEIEESTDQTTAEQINTSGEIELAMQEESNLSKDIIPIRLTPRKKNNFNLQFYFSPTISYRRLADNKNGMYSDQRNIPLASNYLSIDRYVDHNPSIGAELGSNFLLKAGRNLTVKSGLQLNYSRYSIKAYKFYFEKASIALNTVGRIADTITAFTSFRNFSGYFPENLQNQYLQVSVPLGAELKLLGNKRLQLSVAGTIQPTYVLFNDTYLLSTDYVNYAKEPSLVRKWNMHTSLETFVSYNVGGIRWQVGPQFRYQLMSSYNDRYPIKEYLMEYSFKIGISKTLR